jgi:hypothetical protein
VNDFLRWLNRQSQFAQIHTVGLIAVGSFGAFWWLLDHYGLRSATLLMGSLVVGVTLFALVRNAFEDEPPTTPPAS